MAGKIPQSFIDSLLDRSDIVEIIDARVKLKKTGRNYSARCPFHEEKTPSFSVNPDKQFYYCFGCGAGGNVLSFIMDYDRTSFVESIEYLAHHHGLDIPREEGGDNQAQVKKHSLFDVIEQANQYYQTQLRQHAQKQKVIDYLKNRGISGEIAKFFGIGYAPPGWDNLINSVGKTPELKQQLIDTGMLIEKEEGNGVYDRFRDRLMFPIRDNRGRTIAFGGRVFTDEKPKYLNSPETALFHKQQELYGLYEARQANRHLERLLMVEGYMDVVALAQFGINFAVATLGTSAGTTHMEKVFRHCQEVIFCFDGDEAGRKAAHRALEAVLPMMTSGRQAKFLFLPEGDDPDSLVRRIGKDKFLWHIENALSLSEHLFNLHEKLLDLKRADDKAKLISNIMPHINLLPAGALQEILLRTLAEKTGLPIDDIKTLEWGNNTNAAAATPAHMPATTPTKGPSKSQTQRPKLSADARQIKRTPARTALALLLLNPEFANNQDIAILVNLNQGMDDAELRLLIELIEYISSQDDINVAKLIGYWQSQQKPALNRLLAYEATSENKETLQQEYREAIEQLLKQQIRENHSSLIENLSSKPNIRLEDMDIAQREQFLAIFTRKNN